MCEVVGSWGQVNCKDFPLYLAKSQQELKVSAQLFGRLYFIAIFIYPLFG